MNIEKPTNAHNATRSGCKTAGGPGQDIFRGEVSKRIFSVGWGSSEAPFGGGPFGGGGPRLPCPESGSELA